MVKEMDNQVPNLLVLVNNAPRTTIRVKYPEHEIFDDSGIFRSINGMPVTLGGSVISVDSFSELAQKIEDAAKMGNKILVHSFNPIIYNALESRTQIGGFKAAKVITDHEGCRNRFIKFDGSEFSSLLDSQFVSDGLSTMGIGEALCKALFVSHSNELNKAV